jgi:hypothetical protein
MKDPADKVTIDMLLPMPQLKPQTWEEALDQLADEKQALREVLHNIVTEWERVGDDSCCFEKMEQLTAQAQRILEETT